MALTDLQRADVRRFLGFPDQTTGFYSRLEGAMEILTPNAEARVIELLDRLVSIETKLFAALDRLKVSHVDRDIRLRGPEEIMTLREEGNRNARHLGIILGTGVLRYPFVSGTQSGIAGRA